MTQYAGAASRRPMQPPAMDGLDMEHIVGIILLGGVVLSMALIVVGLAWHWAVTGTLDLSYSLRGMNLFQFLLHNLELIGPGDRRPRVLINLGIVILMLTPYARVLASVCYFAFVERNRKYAAFTAFVLILLTYSLFLQ